MFKNMNYLTTTLKKYHYQFLTQILG